jgi:hypothetical protein
MFGGCCHKQQRDNRYPLPPPHIHATNCARQVRQTSASARMQSTFCNADASCDDSPSCACGVYVWRFSFYVVFSANPCRLIVWPADAAQRKHRIDRSATFRSPSLNQRDIIFQKQLPAFRSPRVTNPSRHFRIAQTTAHGSLAFRPAPNQ